jgi:anthranilate phosphoribosyltransferase
MISESISKLAEKQELNKTELLKAMKEIMDGNATGTQTGAFLTALRIKGETIDDISACASLMREKCIKINPKCKYLVDTCGTGGDNFRTFNISTAAAFVVSGCFVSVAKHGGKSVSSKCGSADVLKELGVKIDLEPNKVEKCIEEVGIGFMFAPLFHPAMKNVAAARKELGVRTIFNILGPLSNPANAKSQLIGVYDEKLIKVFAKVLKNLGSKHVIIAHSNGLDEISLIGKTKICELSNGCIKEYEFNPKYYGFDLCSKDELLGQSISENAAIIREILSGKNGPKRDIVVINAAAALIAGNKTNNFKEAIKLSEKSIDSGNAMKKLTELIEFTNQNDF